MSDPWVRVTVRVEVANFLLAQPPYDILSGAVLKTIVLLSAVHVSWVRVTRNKQRLIDGAPVSAAEHAGTRPPNACLQVSDPLPTFLAND